MILGLGLDLTEIDRVRLALDKWGDRFVEKLMEEPEASLLPRNREERAIALASAVAGKEAASKAIGTGWSRGVQWRHVIVLLGREPSVRLEGRAAAVARRLGGRTSGPLLLETRGNLVVAEYRLVREST